MDEKDSDVDKSENVQLLPAPTHIQVLRSKGKTPKIKPFIILLTAVAAMGGFLMGYDTGVVSGAMLKIRETFQLNDTWQELIVSATIGAAMLAAAVAGVLCDLIGRRPTLILSSLVFTIGAVVMGAAYKPWMLLIGRIIVGFGIGVAAMASPMYIAEMAPPEIRGKLVVMNNMFITGGQFFATIVDGVFSYLPTDLSWRFMLGLAGVPSLVMFVGLLAMPESPRWLVYHRKDAKARMVLEKVRTVDVVDEELVSIKADFDKQQKFKLGFINMVRRLVTTRTVLIALLVGCGLQLFQQLAGINTVMYYSASIFQMAGFSDQSAIWLAAVPAFANFLFTIVGLVLVDRLGRRKLLIGSIVGSILGFILLAGTFVLMNHFSTPGVPLDTVNGTCQYYSCGACVGNSECGFCVDYDVDTLEYLNGTCSMGMLLPDGSSQSEFHPNGSNSTCALAGEYRDKSLLQNFPDIENASALHRKWVFTTCPNNLLSPLAIVALIVYIASFASGFGPIPWTVNSEIYPTWARSTAISMATTVNWSSNLLISMTFLTLADDLGQPITFGMYAVLCVFGLLFVILLLPETKGKKLEDIEDLFQRPHFLNWCRKDTRVTSQTL